MHKAQQHTPSSDAVRTAVLNQNFEKGRLLAAVKAYERGDWGALMRLRIDPEKVAKAYLDTVGGGAEDILH